MQNQRSVRPFTARSVAAFPPPTGGALQIDYWDAAVRGFGLRVNAGGRRTWFVRYRQGKRRPRLVLGTFPVLSLADARERARGYLRDASDGNDPAAAKQARTDAQTFAELAVEYLERHAKKHKRSWKEDERIIKAELLPSWKHIRVEDLARPQIRALIEAIADRPAPIMANRTLALVSRMLNFALRRDWIEANPAALIEKPGKETSRERTLTEEEIRELWAALGETVRSDDTGRPLARLNAAMNEAFKLRLLTAQRGGEVFTMRWQDIDIDGGWWTIPGSVAKNEQPHRVPLTQPALDILKARRSAARTDAVWVFENKRGSNIGARGKKAASYLSLGDGHRNDKRTLQRKGGRTLPGLSFTFQGHDLRRTAASGMAAAGVRREHISKVLNHVDGGPRATSVYDRYAYDVEKREALEAWARRLDSIVHDRASNVIAFTR